jgi:radical SAM superfamily enzyme
MEQFNLQLKLQNQRQKCDAMGYTTYFSGVTEHHNQVGSICALYSEGLGINSGLKMGCPG